MYQMKNKSVINATHNSAVLLPTTSSTSAQLSIACGPATQ